MTRTLLTLSLLVVTCCCFAQEHGPKCCTSKYKYEQWDTLDLKTLSAEYLRLKHKKCADCSDFSAPFNDILKALGKRLNGKTQQEVMRIMGKPDEIEAGNYLYYWRGRHDYLIFHLIDGKAVYDWYQAGD